MATGILDSPWLLMSGLVGTLFIIVMSAIIVPAMSMRGKSQVKQQITAQSSAKAVAKRKSAKAKQDLGRIEDELWFPEVTFKPWQEASSLPGCPWCFDGCETVQDVIKSIWRTPLHTGLQQALSALLSRVKGVRVARVHNRLEDETYFAVVYALQSGAELFGGEPLDLSVGLDLDGISEPGIRRRHGTDRNPTIEDVAASIEHGLPCLAPFYRIHNGFGCLLSSKHLPVVLAHPSDTIQGSCYYVYPTRCMEFVRGSQNQFLVKFARVDKQCAAAADCREEHPHVVFAESNGEITEDDEPPLDFVADTVCNIAGQRVVPDGLTYHHAYSGGHPVF